MNLKPEIIKQIQESNRLQGVIISNSTKSSRTIFEWIKNNDEQLTLARYIIPLSAYLKLPIEYMVIEEPSEVI